jgi:hypothetical protein
VRERIPTVERASSLPGVPVPRLVLVWRAEAGKVSYLLRLPRTLGSTLSTLEDKETGYANQHRNPVAGARDSDPRAISGLREAVRRTANSLLVEVAGIEPASFGTSPGLLRAQPAVVFSAPAVSQASRRRAQSLFGVPFIPATGLNGGSS